MRALREDAGPVAKQMIVVGYELTNETRAGLADGVIKVVLSHPARQLGDTLVQAMAEAVHANRSPTVTQHILPFDIYTAATSLWHISMPSGGGLHQFSAWASMVPLWESSRSSIRRGLVSAHSTMSGKDTGKSARVTRAGCLCVHAGNNTIASFG